MERAIPPVSPKTGEVLPGFPDGYYYDTEEGRILLISTRNPKEQMDEARKFELYPDDVIGVGYSKSGTTLLREILWLMHNNVDLEGSRKECVWNRTPTVECCAPDTGPHLPLIKEMKRPRYFMSHTPFWIMGKQILAKKPRVIVMLRNPKDVQVSSFYFMNSIAKGFATSFEDWFEYFKHGYALFGDWFNHVLSYWVHRDKPNLLFLRYEDMIEDPEREIRKIATFLGKVFTNDEIQKIVHATSFKEMSENPGTNISMRKWVDQSVSKFQRKDKVGDWKNYFTEEQSQYVDVKCKERLEPVGLKFRFEL